MADNYVEVFRSKIDFPKPFQRTGKFPLDRTEMFDSYEDAVKYAAGNRADPDSRGLCGTSYIGQTITVYEKGVVADYKIVADRSLQPCIPYGKVVGSLMQGELSTTITLPVGCKSTNVVITDNSTGEMIFTDVQCLDNTVTISLSEAYSNSLDIVVSYCVN